MMSGPHKRRGGRQRVCEANEQRRRPVEASPEPPHKATAEWLDWRVRISGPPGAGISRSEIEKALEGAGVRGCAP